MMGGTAAFDRSVPTPDGRSRGCRCWQAGATRDSVQTRVLTGWAKTAIRPSQYFNSDLNLRFQNNRYGVIHQVNWDVKNQSLTQHRIASYYNAQCCGFSAEYQFIDLTRIATSAVPKDSRFHFSVTLGGVGNVSNIFGALGGTNQR